MNYTIKMQLIILVYSQIGYKEQLKFLKWSRENNYPFLTHGELQKICNQVLGVTKQLFIISEEKIVSLGRQSIMIGEENYPKLWYQIFCPPLLIFYRGNIDLLSSKLVSIVGSRNVNLYAKTMTERLTKELIGNNIACVSGMARGIDQVVHQTAIKENNRASTIAIIASGMDRVYPKEHYSIQEQIAKHHLLLSEFPEQAPPLKHHFIMRNRLVAGLTSITCVMQAAIKSGSLITANYALQNNRELFVLPGRSIDIGHQGCNELIEQGARMILTVDQAIHQITEIFAAHQE